MNLLFAKAGLLAGIVLTGYLQLPSTPPIKLGLWESNTTMTMKMPGMAMPQQTYKSRACVTADSWAKTLGSTQRMDVCTRTNESYAGGHFTFDITCPGANGKGHADFDLTGTTSTRGTIHMELMPGRGPATSDTVVEGHFVSADCGSVVPGRPVAVQ